MAPHKTPKPERDRKLRGPIMLRSDQQQPTTYDQRLLESMGSSDHDWKHADPWRVMRIQSCLLYTSPSPRDVEESRMPSSA